VYVYPCPPGGISYQGEQVLKDLKGKKGESCTDSSLLNEKSNFYWVKKEKRGHRENRGRTYRTFWNNPDTVLF